MVSYIFIKDKNVLKKWNIKDGIFSFIFPEFFLMIRLHLNYFVFSFAFFINSSCYYYFPAHKEDPKMKYCPITYEYKRGENEKGFL